MWMEWEVRLTFDEPSKTLICDGEIAVPTRLGASFICPLHKILNFRVTQGA